MPLPGTFQHRPSGWLRPAGAPVLDFTDSINAGLTSCFIFAAGLNDVANHNQPALISALNTVVQTSINPLGRVAITGPGQYFQFAQKQTVLDTPQMSVSLWLVATAAVASFDTIFSQGSDGTSQPRYLDCRFNLSGDPGPPYFITWADFDGSNSPGALSTIDLNAVANVNKLFHVVGTSDGVTARIFINGQLNASGASHTLNSNAKPFDVGYLDMNGTDSRMFTGNVDNVRTYSRILTQGEVARLYVDPWAGLVFPRDRIMSLLAGARTLPQIDASIIGESNARVISRGGMRTSW